MTPLFTRSDEGASPWLCAKRQNYQTDAPTMNITGIHRIPIAPRPEIWKFHRPCLRSPLACRAVVLTKAGHLRKATEGYGKVPPGIPSVLFPFAEGRVPFPFKFALSSMLTFKSLPINGVDPFQKMLTHVLTLKSLDINVVDPVDPYMRIYHSHLAPPFQRFNALISVQLPFRVIDTARHVF